MNKSLACCFLSLFASAFAAPAVAESDQDVVTFYLTTPRYYVDGNVVWEDATSGMASPIKGTCGAFPCYKGFTTSSSYYCNSASGYYASGWKLVTAGMSGNTEIQTWGSQNSITVTFDYDWAREYGTALELIAYVGQMGYTLEYDANGGDWKAGEPDGGEYKYFDTVTAASADSVEKENCVLSGWKSKGGSLIKPGAEFDGDALGVTQNGQTVTLYAQWGAETYNVTLNKDGGTVAKGTDVTSYTYGVGATLPTLEKKNYKFEGWYDNPQLISNVVTKITKTDSGDKEYWAKFVQQDTVVHYNGNGATSGTMADSSFSYGKALALSKNAFSRVFTVTYDANGGTVSPASEKVEYSFKNWNSQPDGNGSYTYDDLEDVTNPCGSKGEAVTLYAQWQPDTQTVTLPSVTPSDTFTGWYTAKNGGIRVGGAGDEYAPAWNVRLYAHWGDAKSYTVKFSPGAETTGSMADIQCASGKSITLPACGYAAPLSATKFAGWQWGGKTYKVGDSFNYESVGDNDEVLFCAVWETSELSKAVGLEGVAVLTNVSTGAWVPNVGGAGVKCPKGNSNSSMAMIVRGVGTLTFDIVQGNVLLQVDGETLAEPYKVSGTGLHAVKWVKRGNLEDTVISNVVWTPDSPASYKVTASANSSSAGTVTGGGTKKYGDTVTLTATANSGYTFDHWSDGNTSASRTVTVTCAEDYQAIFSGGETGTSCYYVLFDGNGADNMSAMDGQAIEVGASTALTANKFTRSGYKFEHWGSTRSGGKPTYADKESVTNLATTNKTVTLYAMWEVDASASGSGSDSGSGSGSGSSGGSIAAGAYASRIGEAVEVDLLSDYPNIKSVSGLPSGLKYTKKTGLVTGTPKKAVSKTDNVKLTFTDKTTAKITWTVEALPTTMVGTYYGRAYVDGAAGQFQLKLTAAGKATGYFYTAGKKVSFKSTALACEDDDCFAATVTYTYNRTKCTDTIYLTCDATVAGVKGDVDLWFASVGESDVLDDVEAERDTIKEVFGKVSAETVAVMEKTEDGEYLTAKISTAGVVKVSGKLLSDADKLVSVSCSTHALVDENGGEYFYVTIYKTVSKSEPIVVDEIVE